MALPNYDNLKTLDWAFRGGPFFSAAVKSTIDLNTMDWAFRGGPFVVNPYGAAAPAVLGPQMGYINFQDPGIL